MPADLTTAGFFQRHSVVLRDDHLVMLEHRSTQDRVRRIPFDRVETVVWWWTLPWGRMAIYGFLFGGLGLVLLALRHPIAYTIGGSVIGVATVVIGRYIYMGKTTIQITRAGSEYVIQAIASPKKIRRLITRLESAIIQTQQQGEAPILSPEPQEPAEPHHRSPTDTPSIDNDSPSAPSTHSESA